MEEWQWLTTPVVALAAVFVTWYLGKQNLSNARRDFEHDAAKRGQEEGFFRGTVTERLAILSEGQGRLEDHIRQVSDEMRGEMRQMRGEMGQVRGEMGQVREELGEVRDGLQEVRNELGEVRAELGTVASRVTALEASAA